MTVQTEAQWHATLRFASGVTAAFVLCELLEWTPSFLAAALAAALLANLPVRPPMKVVVGLLLAMSVSALLAFLLSVWFRITPTLLFGVVAVCMLASFHKMLGGGSPLPPLLMLICLATIPVITLVAPAQANFLPIALVRGMAVALAILLLVWLLWPKAIPPTAPPPAAPRTVSTLRLALLATAVILPLMLVYLLFGLADVLPVMIASVMLVATFDPRRGRTQALGMIAGNFGGGLLGLVMHALLLTTPSVWVLAALLFLVTLGFGARMANGGPMAPVLVIACNAMLIIFGSAIAEGPGSLSLWIARLLQFALAGAFAIGMMELAWRRFSAPLNRNRASPSPGP